MLKISDLRSMRICIGKAGDMAIGRRPSGYYLMLGLGVRRVANTGLSVGSFSSFPQRQRAEYSLGSDVLPAPVFSTKFAIGDEVRYVTLHTVYLLPFRLIFFALFTLLVLTVRQGLANLH